MKTAIRTLLYSFVLLSVIQSSVMALEFPAPIKIKAIYLSNAANYHFRIISVVKPI
ncbi:MAG: hypothetical protein NDI77_16180 [Geobacteraceae bacterium]|nr:hypothetical protein [Geobacteraceae bacterium]